MPVSFSSITSRSVRMGSTISIRKGPTCSSSGSAGARREPWNECCSPPRTMLNPQSMMPRLG